jgi:hypothetical protein
MMPDIETLKSKIWDALPDQAALSLQYWRAHGRFPNLLDPKTFTEKVQVRKLYDRDVRLPDWADKAKVKDIIAPLIGIEHVIPTLFLGKDIDTFAVRNLPRPFVIKPTHSCGDAIFIRENDDPHWVAIKLKCDEWINRSYGTRAREWLYEQIEPRIIVEPMLGGGEIVPVDYKWFVFDGVPRYLHVDYGRYRSRTQAIMDADWNRVDAQMVHPRAPDPIPRPKGFDDMKRIAATLGKGFDFVRIDQYDIDGAVYFGEATFYPGSGFMRYDPVSFDETLGKLWKMGSKA